MSRERTAPIAIVGVVIAVVAAIVLLSLDDAEDDAATTPSGAARPATSADLADLAERLGHPVYWVGEREGTALELTEEAGGEVYVRYLSGDAEAGDPRSDFLTVGTYPVGDAEKVVRRAASEAGAPIRQVPRGGIAFLSPANEGSAYVAFPGSDLQIEVYDPVPGRALELAEAGRVVPAG